jgi:L-ascorbate metabolism protein UlaG (beta-lactamase superfamily)
MKLTKFEHACLVAEIDGARLIVDPGVFTLPLADITNVVAIVITHEHADHWTADHLEAITKQSPEARIFAPAGVAAAASAFEITTVAEGDIVIVEPFTLAFYGSTHAVIHSSFPDIDNVGVMINDTVFYPGDSFTIPPVPVDTLAVPAGAPWLKIGEVIDYVVAVNPKRSFPTHQMVLSVVGQNMANERIANATTHGGGNPIVLEPGQSIDL